MSANSTWTFAEPLTRQTYLPTVRHGVRFQTLARRVRRQQSPTDAYRRSGRRFNRRRSCVDAKHHVSGRRLPNVQRARILAAGAILITGTLAFATSVDASSSTLPRCSANFLTMRAGFSGAAAGNVGTPIFITNHGTSSCTLDGFPMVVAHTEATSPRRVTFVHASRSLIYRTASPMLVVLKHDRKASFGISYTDGRDQFYGQGPRCQINFVTVRLPMVSHNHIFKISLAAHQHDGFGPINSCFAGFVLGLTPIVRGPNPPND
jgi:hypothetical protein